MKLGDYFVLWIGLQEGIAGVIYLSQGNRWLGLAWLSYALACVGLAMAGHR